MKYAIIDGEGRAIAFYDAQIHKDMIPKGAIEVDDGTWQRWLATSDELAWDKKKKALVAHIFEPVVTIEQIRTRRNALLAASDWTQLPDASLNAEQMAAWAKYRKALRNLPASAKTPSAIKWPEEPIG